jgi:RNAse (barnase) inhibitor barstar
MRPLLSGGTLGGREDMSSNPMPVFELEGDRIETLDDFYDELSRVLLRGARWGRNLDAFDDVLNGGFGTPESAFLIRWRDHARSRLALGYPETVRQLTLRLARCHPANRENVAADLELARRGAGATVFDWLLKIIRDHGPEHNPPGEGIHLELA